ncbi:tRNA 2-thiocytidine(32) synthetase TtcA [Helicobacter cholecystus]|uniref:tRNA 2-thiocytidine(32) synthetase TtcA n=1 Tax=Helicobacter cholecystus TaxID=45498 RepID=A0A3D8IU54_9HELI|nr:ATP-binding protein [Helicobacter cholecystus]RDU68808.1 tRNA 2-thiocytidine(32) synthetase TtcA [Helicobacter cholecystus]VEJ23914.1 PP-loop family protein [Helicobacter cholecystus]
MTYEISKKILSTVGRTNAAYNLIKEGDRVLLGLSGGKDSILLACLLERMKRHAPFKFEYLAMTVHYGMGEDYTWLENLCKEQGINHQVYYTTIMDTIVEKRREGSSYCSFCSRMRRGALYTQALELNYNKVAIAHHLDDAAESFFMNLTYNGALRSMAPIYKAENGLYVIRPLIHVRERQTRDFVLSQNVPTAPACTCPARRPGSDKPPIAREATKNFLAELEKENPNFFVSLKNAFSNIHANSFSDPIFLDKQN